MSNFVLSGLVTFGDKYIDAGTREYVKGLIQMTQIGRMFLEEKEEAVRIAVKEAEARGEAKSNATTTLRLIDTLAFNEKLSLEEACRKLGVPMKEYDNAKAFLARMNASPADTRQSV